MTTIAELEDRVKTRRGLPPPDLRRAIRKAAGLTHADVAGALGVSRQAVAHWEGGTRTPRAVALKRYSDLLQRLQEI